MNNIGDRVKFKTIGGWYNSGIIRDINDDSYLIEVDELGYKPPKDICIPLPYYARVLLSCEIIEAESEEKKMNTDFLIILDPEIDEETGDLVVVVSKLNERDSLELLGAFAGDKAKEVLDLFLGMKDKEESKNE